MPADVKARQVLWVTEADKAETTALCATLAKEKPGACPFNDAVLSVFA